MEYRIPDDVLDNYNNNLVVMYNRLMIDADFNVFQLLNVDCDLHDKCFELLHRDKIQCLPEMISLKNCETTEETDIISNMIEKAFEYYAQLIKNINEINLMIIDFHIRGKCGRIYRDDKEQDAVNKEIENPPNTIEIKNLFV